MMSKDWSTDSKIKKNISPSEALTKIFRYCAYQERCHQEVRSKLFGFGLRQSDVDEILTRLITDGFLNEERFARAFAGGKFRMQKWGRLKIVQALEGKGLTRNCIRSGLKEIAEEDYVIVLEEILTKKAPQFADENEYVRRDKLSRYAIQKGYEPDVVWELLKEKF